MADRCKSSRGREPRNLIISSLNNDSIKSASMWASRGRSMATHTLERIAAYRWIDPSNRRIRWVNINFIMHGMPRKIPTTA